VLLWQAAVMQVKEPNVFTEEPYISRDDSGNKKCISYILERELREI